MAITDTEQFEHVLRDADGDDYQTWIDEDGYLAIEPESATDVRLDKAKATELRDLLNRFIEEAE